MFQLFSPRALRGATVLLCSLTIFGCKFDKWDHDDDPSYPWPPEPTRCEPTQTCPSPDEAQYLLGSPELCRLIDFECDAGQTAFSGPCGCGCLGEPTGERPPRPDPGAGPGCPMEGPDTFYLTRDPTACVDIVINCPEGKEAFSSACGCGCSAVASTPPPPEPPSGAECPRPDTPGVRYLCEDPDLCEQIEFSCPAGEGAFSGPCGCGCIAAASDDDCPDPNAPGVLYVNPETCELVSFECPEGSSRFDSSCGCGCEEH